MRRAGLYSLFFVSGVSALIYELAWQRLLNLLFGISTLSVSAVLAAFMGGLALGGLLFGALADRALRPLRLYGWLEAGIAGAGLLVPPGFAWLHTVYPSLYASVSPGPWGGACLRFGLASLLLLLPTTLMGATLPVMGRLALRRSTGLPTIFSLLYAMNTLGGVAGAALTGFVLLRFWGMQQTLWLAAGLNFLVAVAAWLGSRRSGVAVENADAAQVEPPSTEPESSGTAWPWVALGCAGGTGAAAMGIEVIWTRILGILTSNSAYGFALLLTVLLLGLGLGSLIQFLWSRLRGDSWRRLAFCQWLLAAVMLATLPHFRIAPAWLDQWCDGRSVVNIFLGELLLTSAALLAPAVLMGVSMPLLLAGMTKERARFGHWLGRIYAANTLGCVSGAFLTGFVLIPRLGIRGTFGVLVAGTVLIGITAWRRAFPAEDRSSLLHPRFVVQALVPAAAVAGWCLLPHGGFHKSAVEEPRQLLYYQEGNNATVSVVANPTGVRTILVDGQPVAGTGRTNVVDQKMLAHLPLLLHPAPRRALTVGFGSGGTSYSMALHGIQVDCVELEAAVPAAADYFLSENHAIRSHPHFRLIVDDARSWLRVAPERYDVIATDCTNIQYRSNGDLYTVDYFRSMKERLTPTGVAAAWVPANGISGDDLKTLLRSFREVFPHTSVWFMNSLATDFLIVIGTPEVLGIDLDRLRERMLRPGVHEDLQIAGLADPFRLLFTCIGAEGDLTAYLGCGPRNTDDRPVLSYSTYGANFQATITRNLLDLLSCRGDVGRFVKHPASAGTMLRHYTASNDLVLGHIAHLAGAEQAALRYYAHGVELLPNDSALKELVVTAYFALHRNRGDSGSAEESEVGLRERLPASALPAKPDGSLTRGQGTGDE